MAPHVSLSSPRLPRPYATRPAARTRSLTPWLVVAGLALALGVAAVAYDLVSRRAPELTPRHRAEELCFLLARPPVFTPPMPVQPSVALVRGRFGTNTPASFALQEMMHFEDQHVLRQWSEHVGDYDVSAFWLRLPGSETDHWLVLAWMEDADLAVCNFKFAGTTDALSPQERAWGMQLMHRLLVPDNFRRGVLPSVRLRATDGQTMPSFGPHPH